MMYKIEKEIYMCIYIYTNKSIYLHLLHTYTHQLDGSKKGSFCLDMGFFHSNNSVPGGHDEEIEGANRCSVRDTALLGAVTWLVPGLFPKRSIPPYHFRSWKTWLAYIGCIGFWDAVCPFLNKPTCLFSMRMLCDIFGVKGKCSWWTFDTTNGNNLFTGKCNL